MHRHILKHDHYYGQPIKPVSWCSVNLEPLEWYFMDTHHAALAAGNTGIAMCQSCVENIISAFEQEIDSNKGKQ